jgi:hypothetical protein
MKSITIPYNVPSQNVRDRWHWSIRNRDKNLAVSLVRLHLSLADYRPSTLGAMVRVTITAYRKRRMSDAANLVGGAKGLVDALVTTGILTDDDTTHCSITYHQEQLKHSPMLNTACTVIEWEEVS